MFSGEYCPFETTILIAAGLLTFSDKLVLMAVGKVSQWTFLTDDSPPFIITAGTRALTISLIVLTYIFIDKSNYIWFGGAIALFALLAIVFINKFRYVLKAHTCRIPLLRKDGSQKKGWFKPPKFKVVVIGSEGDMKQAAAEKYKELGAVSLCKFLSGYGQNEVNNPETIWTKGTLAKISSKMTLLLIGFILCCVMTLYLAAYTVVVHQRPIPTSGTDKVLQSLPTTSSQDSVRIQYSNK